jgi:hypothetical protein
MKQHYAKSLARKGKTACTAFLFFFLCAITPSYSQNALDVGAYSMSAPATTGCHTSTETVTIVIKNYGTGPINYAVTPVTVSASTTGANPVSFPAVTLTSGTLNAGATQSVNMTVTYNLTAVGNHTFSASTSMTGDQVAANNAMAPVTIFIGGGTATASPGSVCQGNSSLITVATTTSGGTIQWQESPNASTWTNIVGANSQSVSVTPTALTYYRAQICGTYYSTIDTVTVSSVTAPTATGGTRCGPGPVTLSASGSGTLNWYASATGGTALDTGASFTANVAATTDFYVSSSDGGGTQNVGPPGNTIGGGAQQVSSNYNTFDVISPCVLQSVVVYPGTSGTNVVTLEWVTSTNVVITSTQLSFTAAQVNTPVTVTLNWNLTPGTNYRLRRAGTGSLYRSSSGVSYPYTIPGVVSITGSAAGGSYFYWAYNWTVVTGCESPRTLVTATVTSAPAISATSPAIVCSGDSTALSVTSSNSPYYFLWSPSTALSDSTGSAVFAGTFTPGNYTYYVEAIDSTTQCRNRDTVTYEVKPIPSVTGTSNTNNVCGGTQVNLTATQPPASIQVSNGTVVNGSTSYPAPYGNWFWGAKHQMLILASELTAAGLTAGNLTSISFDVQSVNNCPPLQNFEIQMKLTTITAMTTSFESGLTQVTTPVTYTPVTGANVHTFIAPFYWDGVSNIIVQTCFNNSSYLGSGNASFTQVATPFSSTLESHQDASAVCANPAGNLWSQRPNITFETNYTSWTYAWSPANLVANPTALNTNATVGASNTDFIITVTDTLSGCTADDTVTVNVLATPDPDFGPDTSLCSNSVPVMLDAGAGPNVYMWQDNSTAQTFPVMSAGTYYVDVINTNTGCNGKDTITLTFATAPVFSLGNDMTVCEGTPVTFSGPSGPYMYDWNTNATSQSISPVVSGTYILDVIHSQTGCGQSDTVMLSVNPSAPLALGNDTNICGSSYTLNAPNGNYTYQWSTNATTASINVTASGSYSVQVTDNATGCIALDTITVLVNPNPVVALGSDTAICSGDLPYTLSAPQGNYAYLWNDNSTNQSLNVNAAGNYSVSVTDNFSGCSSTDAINITLSNSPSFSLGNDTTFCSGAGPVTLSAPGGYTYAWSDQSTSSSITVNASGNYSVTITDPATGCSANDAIVLNVPLTPAVNLNDTTICASSYTVSAPSSPAYVYQWSTGATTSSITINSPGGNYSVTVTDTTSGCSAMDAANFTVNAPPQASFSLQNIACTTDAPVTLTGTPAGGAFSGPGVSGNIFNPSVSGAGTFTITYTYTDPNGCTATATNSITVSACVGVTETNAAQAVTIYPNPTNGTITVSISDVNGEVEMELTSLHGQVIYSDKTNISNPEYVRQLDLAAESNGIYFLRVTVNGRTEVYKIVKQE